jgi:hypothetical protein
VANIADFVAMSCLAVCLCSAQQPSSGVRPQMGYELYSWQEANGVWRFQLLFNTSAEKTPKEVFNKKTAIKGVEKLNERIAQLPEGSTIFWLNRVPSGTKPKARGSDRLKYPSEQTIDYVRRAAATRHIEVQVLSS